MKTMDNSNVMLLLSKVQICFASIEFKCDCRGLRKNVLSLWRLRQASEILSKRWGSNPILWFTVSLVTVLQYLYCSMKLYCCTFISSTMWTE